MLTCQLDLAVAASPGPIAAVDTEAEISEEDEEESSPAVAPVDDDVRQVPRAEAETYAKECGLLFFEASAKTGANVGEVFTEIGELYIVDRAHDPAKAIPLDTVTPKPAVNAARNAGGVPAQERVNLDQGGQAKKAGCC